MKTLDQILFDLPEQIPNIDAKPMRVLNGFKKYIKSHGFLTERQSEYLVLLYTTYEVEISPFSPELSDALKTPIWSQPFKRIITARTLKLIKHDGIPTIEVEFTYSNLIKRILSNLPIAFSIIAKNNSTCCIVNRLCETSIIMLVNALLPHNFIIDKEIYDLYNQINGWRREDIEQQYSPSAMGFDSFATELIKYDRRHRHQYHITPPEPTNLVETIAYRRYPRMWLDLKNNSLYDIISAVIELQRFPLMVVLPNNSSLCKWMTELSDVIQQLKIDKVGVYFREDRESAFNSIISQNGYNVRLNDETNIAVCQYNRLPKIFLSSGWQPMSVLAIDTQLRVNTVSNYAYQYSDLIITATDDPPLVTKTINH